MPDDKRTLDELMKRPNTGREEEIANRFSYDEILEIMRFVVDLDKAIAKKERSEIGDDEMRFMGQVVASARDFFYRDPSVSRIVRDTLPYVEKAYGRIREYREKRFSPVSSDNPPVQATLDWLKEGINPK